MYSACDELYERMMKQYTGKAHPSHSEIRIPELEIRENARWMALLIDTEGAMGWTSAMERIDKMNEEYRYVYRYVT